jgi:hypothetical protein
MKSCPACGRIMASCQNVGIPDIPSDIKRFALPLLQGRTLKELAFYAALVPMILPLPAGSLIVFCIRFLQVPDHAVFLAWRKIIVAAITNLIVSIWVWLQISEAIYGFLTLTWGLFWGTISPEATAPIPQPIQV